MSNIDKQTVQAVADLKAGYTLCHADVAILNELARIALASIEAEPLVSLGMLSVKKARKLNLAREMAEVDDCDGCTHYRADICHGGKCAAPPAPVSVPAGYRLQPISEYDAMCAAMLQGDEPAIQPDKLPLDYLQGHKDGLEWAARLAEANHPQTGDWLYDDPLELAKAIRKGPDMPAAPQQEVK